jgi:glycine/D-amino acid oxidase-like deaminating enzyme
MYKEEYENIIIGAGVAGCSLAYFLKKYSKSTLLIDKNEDVAFGASGAAGAFLSPLLGKPNNFKDLITNSLEFSVDFYKKNFSEDITSCGTCRIPKDEKDDEKFQSYKPYMDFEYKKLKSGYFFEIGSVVDPYNICKKLTLDVDKLLNYEVVKIKKENNFWIINDELKTKNLFLCTGADISLIEEKYINIRPVWGQKIDVLTNISTNINYHKECSLSISKVYEDKNIVSIGATHNRFNEDMSDTSYNLKLKNINNIKHNEKTLKIMDDDCNKLLKLANDIKPLGEVKIIDIKIGARASSADYFPIVGRLVDSKKSFEMFPHLINGSFIKDDKLQTIDNLFLINGVGGRGFVLSPYLANNLVENLYNGKEIDSDITTFRLFKRWAKRVKNNN